MLFKRIATAVIGIPAVLFLVWSGGILFFALLTLVTSLALWEFFSLPGLGHHSASGKLLGTALGIIIMAGAYTDTAGIICTPLPLPVFATAGCILGALLLAAYHITGNPEPAVSIRCTAYDFLGLFSFGYLFSHLLHIRAMPHGTGYIFFLMALTWAGDTAAYAVGSLAGKHPLCSSISPRKTIEGALGSISICLLVGLGCKNVFVPHLSVLSCLIVSAGVNILNQTGDLFESAVKRAADVKDSGSILPGHGGVLDRTDSLVFAAPFLLYYCIVITV